MNTKGTASSQKPRFFMTLLITAIVFSALLPSIASAAATDYCITPPFVVGGVKPNLLMMLDNSSSMYDLNYADEGYGACSTSAQNCGTGLPNCPPGETCILTRQPIYCYDKTYNPVKNKYSGYFDPQKFYQYDFVNEIFNEVGALPGGCTKSIAGTLCVEIVSKQARTFAAIGSYLNWLTASKYDVQKQILTGGKFVDGTCSTSSAIACSTAADCPSGETCDATPGFLLPESRGCVGRAYIKEPITANYVEGSAPADLGIVFGVRGPADEFNATALSPGGQTYIDIYEGNYDQAACGAAVNNILTDAQKQVTTDSIALCLGFTGGKTCLYDSSISCTKDADCPNITGICSAPANGVCGALGGGVCGASGGGVCNVNNGTCTGGKVCSGGSNPGTACTKDANCKAGGVCRATCVGGGKAGSSCSVNADCNFSSCTAGKPAGTPCANNSDCNVAKCSAGKPNTTTCTQNSDCNVATCSAGNVGNPCTVNSDCNSGLGTCSAGKPATTVCTKNTDCDNLTGTCAAPSTSQIKSTFGQNMHSCYQLRVKGQEPNNAEINQISNPNGCNQIYKEEKVCVGGSKHGLRCSALADCPGGTVCRGGPDTIMPGSPVLICNAKYAGYCASNPASDNWQTTAWVAREFASADECIVTKYKEFCGDLDAPPVVDPTDDASNTANFTNVPAILGELGLGGQLGNPVGTIEVRIAKATAPAGLFHDFSDQIRFGIMSFNYNGSLSECGLFCSNDKARACTTNADCVIGADKGTCSWYLPCPKKCSVTTSRVCTTYLDCPGGESCVASTKGTDNRDGGKIMHYIGAPGRCSVSVATACTRNSDCPGAESCISVGNHKFGLVSTVNRLRATAWTPFAEAFYNAVGYYGRKNLYSESPAKSNIDLRLGGDNDFIENNNPSQYECQKNNVLLISDGMSTADRNATVNTFATAYPASGTAGACTKYAGSMNLDNIAWIAKNRNIKQLVPNVAIPAPVVPLKNSEYIDTYVVFTGADNGEAGECNSLTMMNQTAAYGGTSSAKLAEDPNELQTSLRETFQTIAKGAGSGTAASVLASGEGSGANLMQALFYTERKTFGLTFIDPGLTWTGTLKNLWYYLDPFIGSSTIREDTDNNDILTLTGDDILRFRFTGSETVADLYNDADGDGVTDTALPHSTINFEDVKSLWEAGSLLHSRSPGDRKIFTSNDGVNRVEFITPSTAALRDNLGMPTLNLADRLISYVRGNDFNYCSNAVMTNCTANSDCPVGGTCIYLRNRTVTINGVTNTWKLGDIVNSTPRIASSVPLNHYFKVYNDTSYDEFTRANDYESRGMVFTGANDGMLHAFFLGNLATFQEKDKKASLTGANIGKEVWAYIPQHALPFLKFLPERDYCHVYYVDATPYIIDASVNSPSGCAGDYWDCPKQTVRDAGNNLVLADTSWRTILIGNMRLGGSCKNACDVDVNKDGVINTADCVETPLADKGYSSYFALDITETLAHPDNPTLYPPKLLWEFSDANLNAAEKASGGIGFATTGPSIIRVAAKKEDSNSDGVIDGLDKPDHAKNGRFFVVIGSGPTGPVESRQFKGFSDQPLKLFIFDLAKGPSADLWVVNTGIKNSFAGNMLNSAMDFEQSGPQKVGFYQDEAAYFGFAKAEEDPITVNTKWNSGGLLRLLTGRELNPTKWTWSKVMDNIGPVTAGVAKLHNPAKKEYRLFFGSGRYFYKIAEKIDDANPKTLLGDTPRRLYGVTDPCYDTNIGTIDDGTCNTALCTTALTCIATLTEAADANGTNDPEGWYINLDICTEADGLTSQACTIVDALGNTIPNPDAKYTAERNVTDIAALRNGAVLFTTTKPSADICAFGGGTHLWASQWDTGGRLKPGILRGKALVQVSTGEIKEIDLKTAFTEKDGRRSVVIPGVPPAGDPPGVLVPPLPARKIMHMRER